MPEQWENRRPRARKIRQSIRDGELLASPVVSTSDPTIVELFGRLGFDWLFLDTEHTSVAGDGRAMTDLIRACDAVGVAPTMRVRRNDPSLIAAVLDAGAQGIWVPRVESAADAWRAVDAARFPPHGHRGAAPIARSASYALEDWDAYVSRVAEETAVIIVVETQAGVDNVDEIASVEGVDAIVFGQFDYGVDRGLPQSEFFAGGAATSVHPVLEDSARKVVAACTANGVMPGTVAWSRGAALHWIELGFRMFVFGTDYTLLGAAARALLSDLVALEEAAGAAGSAGR